MCQKDETSWLPSSSALAFQCAQLPRDASRFWKEALGFQRRSVPNYTWSIRNVNNWLFTLVEKDLGFVDCASKNHVAEAKAGWMDFLAGWSYHIACIFLLASIATIDSFFASMCLVSLEVLVQGRGIETAALRWTDFFRIDRLEKGNDLEFVSRGVVGSR